MKPWERKENPYNPFCHNQAGINGTFETFFERQFKNMIVTKSKEIISCSIKGHERGHFQVSQDKGGEEGMKFT